MIQAYLHFVRSRLRSLSRPIESNGQRIRSMARRVSALGLVGSAFALTWGAGLLGKDFQAPVFFDDGRRMSLDLRDAPQLYMFLFNVWEPSITEMFDAVVDRGRVVVDVGAHVGYHALLAWSLGAEVLAFEADKDAAHRLEQNIALNAADEAVSVTCMAAASDGAGRLLHRGPIHNRGLTSTRARWNLSGARLVPSVRLDLAINPAQAQRVQVIKIDVEGAEPDVLGGMTGLWNLLPNDAILVLEMSPRWWSERTTVSEVLGEARAAGFDVWTVENSYSPMRYLRRYDVMMPQPVQGELSNRRRRHDLVLARRPVWMQRSR